MSEGQSYNGLIAFSFFVISCTLIKQAMRANHYEDAYWAERRGRARVEKEMKKLATVQLNTQEGFFVQPIAVIQSCYRQCVGTPRQGALVPSSRATIKLTRNISPEAMDGLDEFSHIWITFKFHLNTNTLKEAKAFSGIVSDSRKFTFTAKITPPMLKEKKGVLATRSPHRPNPFGVTLARIERIDKKKNSIYVSACDLVDGTPVLDIKPYVPAYDTVTNNSCPKWILETIGTRNEVRVASDVLAQIKKIQSRLREYKNDAEGFLQAIIETLEADVRSKFQTNRRILDSKRDRPVEVPFDEAFVKFLWLEDRVLEIVGVSLECTEKPVVVTDDEPLPDPIANCEENAAVELADTSSQ